MTDGVRYLCIVRLDRVERVFLWEGEDPGPARIEVDEGGFVLSFSSAADATNAALGNGWPISSDDASAYDLDAIERWCRTDESAQDCMTLLNAWNLLVDLPGAENLFRAADERALGLYDKLFRACNLPSMTPPRAENVPVWSTSETAALKHLLLLGTAELRARLR